MALLFSQVGLLVVLSFELVSGLICLYFSPLANLGNFIVFFFFMALEIVLVYLPLFCYLCYYSNALDWAKRTYKKKKERAGASFFICFGDTII